MAPGADKVISLDPPGTIGLRDRGAVVMLRFDEAEDGSFPIDEAAGLRDMDAGVTAGLTLPSVVSAVIGRGRQFDDAVGLASTDRVNGTTLLTRDCSIQAVVSWSAAAQEIVTRPGAIISRGIYTGSPGTGTSYGLQVAVVDAPSFTASLQWFWSDLAGVEHVHTGAHFTLLPGAFTMLTATRRWVSPTSVSIRYYIGDLLLGEFSSSNGSIAGATTEDTTVGTRFVFGDPDFGDAYQGFFAGVIDEIMVVGRELCAEEVEATWLRITRYQPLGLQLFIESHDQGFPGIEGADTGSDFALDTRMQGHAIGYAAAAIEELRANFLPGRAYGSTLQQWEEITRPRLRPNQSIDVRRARVIARLRQRRGSSPDGIGDALVDLIGDATVSDLEILAFSSTITEDFAATINPLRWDVTPAASWTTVSGKARASLPAGSYVFDGTAASWRYIQRSIGGDGKQAKMIASVVMTTPQANLEAGVFFACRATRDYLLLGLRDVAGVFKIVSESFIAGVSQGVVVQATLGSNPAALWLRLEQTTTDGQWGAAYSTASGTGDFNFLPVISHPTVAHWLGMYARSTAATAGSGVVDVDSFIMHEPFGTRPFNAYVLLDEALGFTPDSEAARSVIADIKHGFIHGTFITQPVFLCGDPDSGCGLGPLGGY